MILALWREQGGDLAALGDRANWPRIELEFRSLIVPQLRDVFIEAAEAMAAVYGVPYNPEHLAAASAQWAIANARTVAEQVTATTRQHVAYAIQKARSEHAGEEALILLLLLGMSDVRAEGIAITTTTGTVSAGERWLAAEFNRQGTGSGASRDGGGPFGGGGTGEQLVPFWHTEQDGLVCNICRPLHGQPEEVWSIVAPAGPEAHPRCRCWLRWEKRTTAMAA